MASILLPVLLRTALAEDQCFILNDFHLLTTKEQLWVSGAV